jgi:6-phosphogluconolactonase/glucosamine-6-phosphate isomerase/deaminase
MSAAFRPTKRLASMRKTSTAASICGLANCQYSTRSGIAAAVYVEKLKQHRVTLLPGVLERARHTLCLATGDKKAEALRKVLRGPFDPLNTPSQIASSDAVWYIDKSAAAKL